jgi:hypothetical protein
MMRTAEEGTETRPVCSTCGLAHHESFTCISSLKTEVRRLQDELSRRYHEHDPCPCFAVHRATLPVSGGLDQGEPALCGSRWGRRVYVRQSAKFPYKRVTCFDCLVHIAEHDEPVGLPLSWEGMRSGPEEEKNDVL